MPVLTSRVLRGLFALFLIAPVLVADERPNLVLILGDDQHWADHGFLGSERVRTPHLDRLAQRSLVFERGYVAAPICRPSLASIVTGRIPTEHGITGNDVQLGARRAELDRPLRAAFHRLPSLVRELTRAGYRTHQSGKWWEGSFAEGGFSEGMTHGDPGRGGRHGDAGLAIGRRGLAPVLEFVDRALADEQPFFLWYAPFLPHAPHDPPERLLEAYTGSDLAPDVARYLAMCEWFDETCGELLGHLERRGVGRDTLVVYLADNGWAAASTNAEDPHQEHWQRYALRTKGSPYEGGIRTPILVSWPARIEPGRSPDLAHAIDLFPTLARAAGIEAPADLAGIDLLDPGARRRRERVFGVTHATHDMQVGDPDATLQYLWCVERRWKLVLRRDGIDTTAYRALHDWDRAPWHLYDLEADPHERHDLAADQPETVERLCALTLAWHAGLPRPEADGER